MLPRKLSKVGKAVLAILRAPPPKHVCIWISLCIHAQALLKLVDLSVHVWDRNRLLCRCRNGSAFS